MTPLTQSLKEYTQPLKGIILGLLLVLGINYAMAALWTGPTATPPGNNTDAPINVGSTGQSKSGNLVVGTGISAGSLGFGVTGGNVGIGTLSPTEKLHLGNGSIRIRPLSSCNLAVDANGVIICQAIAPPPPSSGSQTFNYTGANQTFTVPAGVTSISVDAWGAGGGASAGYSTGSGVGVGGAGGRTTGSLSVTPGETLTVIVGGAGQSSAVPLSPSGGIGGSGGFGGGGDGGTGGSPPSGLGGAGGGGGGGRSALQRGSNDIISAGGGGGGSAILSGATADTSAGGGPVGGKGKGTTGATGGDGGSNVGGNFGTSSLTVDGCTAGVIFQGGHGCNGIPQGASAGSGSGGGGGGGRYGGGGGGSSSSAGGANGGGGSGLAPAGGTTTLGTGSSAGTHGKVIISW